VFRRRDWVTGGIAGLVMAALRLFVEFAGRLPDALDYLAVVAFAPFGLLSGSVTNARDLAFEAGLVCAYFALLVGGLSACWGRCSSGLRRAAWICLVLVVVVVVHHAALGYVLARGWAAWQALSESRNQQRSSGPSREPAREGHRAPVVE
jgi:hypothetical protein